MNTLQRTLLVGAICLAVASVPVMTHNNHDDDDDSNCDQAATLPAELLTISFSCYPESGADLNSIDGTGNLGGIGEFGGTGPVASCPDLISSLVMDTVGCIAPPYNTDNFGGIYGVIICSGDRNQVVGDLTTILIGISAPQSPVSVVAQPALGNRR